ncbi:MULTISPECIES: MFS transporter [Yersinia]|nr:MFS transporter [Yersinia kristensenii]MBW5812503.1 MFS transporter [Yersinia kristensenii]MBW5818040.1 MFS transporter [Yersinia kristensenii]MBW5829804.1 MFS transporter [Yersinia kristensenii]MBW5842198.1 MFS transporter [Yersinia kristensenii]MDA5490343.1 MFS transporter [Yersinia kristensenii]
MFFNNRWLILAILTSTLFLIIIDMTVLYTALPSLTSALNATSSEKLWIVNAYPLVVAGLLPGAGMLSDRIGHKRLFMTGLPVFGVASLCAAYSPSADFLIASRVFLAIGAAMMMPATLAIVRQVFIDERERALAIGIWAAVASAAAAFGPIVGGILLEYFWWGSVFLINLPVVLLVFPLALHFIPRSHANKHRPCDLIGSLQIMAGLFCIIYALKELSKINSSFTVAVATTVVGIAFLCLFTRRQQRSAHPMIDFSLFRNSAFTCGVGVAITSMIALIGIELALTQRLQLVLELTPLMAAFYILPIPVASILASILTGILIPRVGERRIILGGFTMMVVGIISLYLLFESGSILQLISLFIIGFGFGCSIAAASTSIMLNTPEEKAGMVAAIEDVSWEMGGVLGVTLLGGVMTAVYSHVLELPDGLVIGNTANDSIDEALRLARSLSQEHAKIVINLAKSAFDQAFMAVLIGAAGLLVTSLAIIKYSFRRAL